MAAMVGDPQMWCDALSGRAPREVEEVLDDASLLHVPGTSGLAGDYQGSEAILGVLRRMASLTDRTLRLGGVSGLVEDERGFRFRGRAEARRARRHLDVSVDVAIAVRGERAVEIWLHHPDQRRVDEFWS
jgi:hypothetical protein